MNHLVEGVRESIKSGNYYSALSLAIALPDICGKLENPGLGSQKRYISWFDDNLKYKYTAIIGPSRKIHVFLSGEDCYALRCAYLHEGEMDITGQKVRETLDKFHMVLPDVNGNSYHIHQIDKALVIQVDLFCEEICQAVEVWLSRSIADPVLRLKIEALPLIRQIPVRSRKS
jgi:hypothetical protein